MAFIYSWGATKRTTIETRQSFLNLIYRIGKSILKEEQRENGGVIGITRRSEIIDKKRRARRGKIVW